MNTPTILQETLEKALLLIKTNSNNIESIAKCLKVLVKTEYHGLFDNLMELDVIQEMDENEINALIEV